MFRDFGRARCRFCVPFIFHSLWECWLVLLVCNGWNETAAVWGARMASNKNIIIVYLFMLLLVPKKATTKTRSGKQKHGARMLHKITMRNWYWAHAADTFDETTILIAFFRRLTHDLGRFEIDRLRCEKNVVMRRPTWKWARKKTQNSNG